jgi:hypothetical protein
MSANPNISDLDFTQALKRCVDSTDDTLRVELSSATGMDVELSAADGDTISALSLNYSGTGTVTSSNVATDVVVAAMDVSTTKQLQLFADVGAGVTGIATLKIQISPSASANVWIDSGVTLAVTGASNLKSTQVSDIAMRARVVVVSNTISAGTGSLYLIARS